MGQIVINIPQNVNRSYQINSEDSARKLIANLEKLVKKELLADDEDILGLWALPPKPREKSASKIRLND